MARVRLPAISYLGAKNIPKGQDMTDNADDWLAEAKPAERTVQLCLRGDLVAEFEELERRLEAARKSAAADDSLASGGEVVAISQQIEQLRERMQAATKTFRLRALPRKKYRGMVAAHPPRRDEDGKLHELDAMVAVNLETFLDPLVRACLVEPKLTEQQMDRLLDEVLSDRQFDELANAAWALNRHDVAVPTSRAASRILETYAEEQRRQSDSASASNGSTAGSPEPSPPTSTTTQPAG